MKTLLNFLRRIRPEVKFLALFGLVLLVHAVWEVRNEVPPPWDMAYHELKGWEYWEAWQEGQFFSRFSSITRHFPPLYYLQEALVLELFGPSQFLTLLSNGLGLFLLSYGTFGIAQFFMEKETAVWAGLTAMVFPFVAWTTRFALLDGLLAGWVAAAVLCLLKSLWFEKRGWTLLFGVACAGGILSKWTFPFYLAVPVLYGVVVSKDRRRALVHLSEAALVAVPVVSLWYLPNLQGLAGRYPTTAQSSLIPWQADPRHGEPGLSSLLGWIYYPRVLASYFLFLPMTCGLIWSGIYWIQNRGSFKGPGGFLWAWLLGSQVVLIFVTPKDPRFALPLVPALAVLLFCPWRGRPRWITAIVLVGLFQFMTVSFNLFGGPVKISLFELDDGDYQSLQREWVLYQSRYFDVAGPPQVQDWRYDDILKKIGEGAARVGFLPELSHFHQEALRLYSFRQGKRLDVVRIGDTEGSLDSLDSLDFLLGKTGDQGLSFITRENERVYGRVREEEWPLLGRWVLPDGSEAMLWENPRRTEREQSHLEVWGGPLLSRDPKRLR